MVTDAKEVEDQSQANQKPEGDQGGTPSQLEGSEAEGQRGAEGDQQTEDKEPAPAPRTFTQEEVSGIESKKDAEIAQYRKLYSDISLEQNIAKAQETERDKQATDQAAVDAGTITKEEAQERSTHRITMIREDLQAKGQQAEMQRERRGLEAHYRVIGSDVLGKQYGVDPKELLEGDETFTVDGQEGKAKSLKIERLENRIKELENGGPEHFDQAQGGGGTGTGADLTGLSPSELNALAYTPNEIARREKAKGR